MPKTDGDGRRVEMTVRMHERRPRRRWRHQPGREAELFAEAQGGWFRREDRVGAGVDRESAEVSVRTSPPRRFDASSSTNGTLRADELERGCEARDAAADDCDHAMLNAEC